LQAFDFDPKQVERFRKRADKQGKRNKRKRYNNGDNNEDDVGDSSKSPTHTKGLSLKKLTETRMRRYLIWSLLAERSLIVKDLNDVYTILRDEKMKIQITPLKFSLNREKDSVVTASRVQLHTRLLKEQKEKEKITGAQLEIDNDESSDDEDSRNFRPNRKEKKEKIEIPYRMFIELNSYFYRINDDDLAVGILESLFTFNWPEMSRLMQKVHSFLPSEPTQSFF